MMIFTLLFLVAFKTLFILLKWSTGFARSNSNYLKYASTAKDCFEDRFSLFFHLHNAFEVLSGKRPLAIILLVVLGLSSCEDNPNDETPQLSFEYPYESWADIDGDYIASSSCGHSSMADHALTYLAERYEDGVDEITKEISSDQLKSFSDRSHEAIISVYPIVNNKDAKRVLKVFDKLKPFTPKDIRSSLEVFLVASKQVANAFTVAGGKIYMTTALYHTLRSDEELALVLGHEIAHQVKGHTTIKLRQSKFLTDNLGPTGGALTNWIINLVTLPFNAPEEYEADCGGMWLSAQAGYNTELGILIFNRWAKLERNAPRNSFISTHPKSSKRFACCATLTAEAKERARNNQPINNQ